MVEICLNVFIGYLCGSFPSSILISRLAGGPDPRTVGSGNPGTTNTIRSLGLAWGGLVFLLDTLKGALPVLAAGWVRNLTGGVLPGAALDIPLVMVAGTAALGALLGHLFPVFAGFKGGKGVATAAGAFMAMLPLTLLGSMAVFFLVLFTWGMVSLSSILGALFLPASYLLWGRLGLSGPFPQDPADSFQFGLCVAVAGLIVLLHRKNIGRIIRGQESRFDKARLFWQLARRLRRK